MPPYVITEEETRWMVEQVAEVARRRIHHEQVTRPVEALGYRFSPCGYEKCAAADTNVHDSRL